MAVAEQIGREAELGPVRSTSTGSKSWSPMGYHSGAVIQRVRYLWRLVLRPS